jgi:hypothetical protein
MSLCLTRSSTRTLTLDNASPATRLLEKRRQMFEVQEALEAQKQEFAKKVCLWVWPSSSNCIQYAPTGVCSHLATANWATLPPVCPWVHKRALP